MHYVTKRAWHIVSAIDNTAAVKHTSISQLTAYNYRLTVTTGQIRGQHKQGPRLTTHKMYCVSQVSCLF